MFIIACRGCLDKFVDDEEHYSIQLELDTGKLYCFKCEDNQAHRVLVYCKRGNSSSFIYTQNAYDRLMKQKRGVKS